MELAPYSYENLQQLYHRFVFSIYPGFEEKLKDKQAEIIHAILVGRDALALLPTAFGKSLCIIAPAIIRAQVSCVWYSIIHTLVADVFLKFLNYIKNYYNCNDLNIRQLMSKLRQSLCPL